MNNSFDKFLNAIPDVQTNSEGTEGESLAAIRELVGVLATNPPAVSVNVFSSKDLSLMEKDQQMRQLAQEILRY